MKDKFFAEKDGDAFRVVRRYNTKHSIIEGVCVCSTKHRAEWIARRLNRLARLERGYEDAKIALGYTSRAFRLGLFRDRNGEECSIQESSLATERCLWLGMDHADICVMSSKSHNLPPPKLVLKDGSTENTGWKKYVLPENVYDFCRMELTQEMAMALSALLLHFAEHGTLPEPKEPHVFTKKEADNASK